MQTHFIKLAVEYWQLFQLSQSMLHEISADNAKAKSTRISFLYRQFSRILEENNLKLVSYNHQRYEPNLPVNVMNKEDVDMATPLIISRTHEPTVLQNDQIIVMGKVFVEPITK